MADRTLLAARAWRKPSMWLCGLAVAVLALVAALPASAEGGDALPGSGSTVAIQKQMDGSFQYVVNGQPQVFIGVGYNPIYRYLSDDDRAANYRRDFQILHDAGVNTITGWDADKGYEQDKFDEVTLSTADAYGIGVVMPMNLPPEGDYTDPSFVDSLLSEAQGKVSRFKDFPAVRMWGVGNEVFWDMPPDMYPAYKDAYLRIVDLFHQADPNHPVIYREAEDRYVPDFASMLSSDGTPRPWLQYGMNVYDKDPAPLLARWPSNGLDRPLFISEFGMEGATPDKRAAGYALMWHSIRCYPQYVLGGAPYAWTTTGPEPTDVVWGLMDGNSQPVDGTFGLLSQAWQKEPAPVDPSCLPPQAVPTPVATQTIVRRVDAVIPPQLAAAAARPSPVRAVPTATSQPATATSTPSPIPTNTQAATAVPTATHVPATSTAAPPTSTPIPPTATSLPATATSVAATATATHVTATATHAPSTPTATATH
ncbi:MAG TPA: glycoside hydrolase family 2 TIM barrel-domain containing protein [Chloroflexota bacterium]|nr:glycoside hydrolase family 2 TIM barrel-domain containing protein [Chloroflexota bacterium]